MSRGISDLQKGILLLGLEKGFLLTQDILCWWWGWELAEWGAKKATIGKSEYNTAHASLSRAISRLWQRGLVVIWKNLTNSATGISLTDAGTGLARTFTAKTENDG